MIDFEFAHDVHGFFLDDNLIEHHGATPHATAGRQFTVELGYLQSGLGQVIGCHNTRRTAAYNGYIEVKVLLQLLKIGTDDTL